MNETAVIFLSLLTGCLFLAPMVCGISMCVRNERLSTGMKAVWILAFLSSSLVALAVYFALYKSGQNTDREY